MGIGTVCVCVCVEERFCVDVRGARSGGIGFSKKLLDYAACVYWFSMI